MKTETQKGRQTGFRFERKFVTSELDQWQLEGIIRQHPALFSPIFWEREVNNIYFDTSGLQFFHDNVSGFSKRKKVRIRWYGEDLHSIKKPVLEFKIKEGFVGYKKSYLLNDFAIPEKIPTGFFNQIFDSSNLPDVIVEELSYLEPTMMNHYKRRYFKSFDKKFRCTVDFDLIYYDYRTRLRGVINKSSDPWHRILELKYDAKFDDDAQHIVNKFPLRVNKSSKYVNGISRFRSSVSL